MDGVISFLNQTWTYHAQRPWVSGLRHILRGGVSSEYILMRGPRIARELGRQASLGGAILLECNRWPKLYRPTTFFR